MFAGMSPEAWAVSVICLFVIIFHTIEKCLSTPAEPKMDVLGVLRAKELRPGDIVVLKSREHFSTEGRDALIRTWKRLLPNSEIRCAVLDGGLDLDILRVEKSGGK